MLRGSDCFVEIGNWMLLKTIYISYDAWINYVGKFIETMLPSKLQIVLIIEPEPP